MDRGGRGDHRNFVYPKAPGPITISGRPGDDAKHYQERAVRAAIEESQAMKESARYAKIVEWSDEDQCYVGSCPGLFFGGCHGADEKEVFAKTVELVEEILTLYKQEEKLLPPATSGKDYANKMLHVA